MERRRIAGDPVDPQRAGTLRERRDRGGRAQRPAHPGEAEVEDGAGAWTTPQDLPEHPVDVLGAERVGVVALVERGEHADLHDRRVLRQQLQERREDRLSQRMQEATRRRRRGRVRGQPRRNDALELVEGRAPVSGERLDVTDRREQLAQQGGVLRRVVAEPEGRPQLGVIAVAAAGQVAGAEQQVRVVVARDQSELGMEDAGRDHVQLVRQPLARLARAGVDEACDRGGLERPGGLMEEVRGVLDRVAAQPEQRPQHLILEERGVEGVAEEHGSETARLVADLFKGRSDGERAGLATHASTSSGSARGATAVGSRPVVRSRLARMFSLYAGNGAGWR